MASTASIAKHPLHPMLVPFPIGLWVFSLVADLIAISGWGTPVWSAVARYTMAGGIVGGVLAAAAGLVDFFTLKGDTVRRLGIAHLVLNVIILGLFAVNFVLRTYGNVGVATTVSISVVAVLLLDISGWLGGELVYVHGVAVEVAPGPKG
jgi:uncharacterized membrane protein